MPLKRIFLGSFYGGLYILLSLSPLLILWLSPGPARGFWVEFSIGLGFVGLAMLSLQFALTARFRRITAPYGIDVILGFHRQISLVAFVFILLHPIILLIQIPAFRYFLDPIRGPWQARMGLLAIVLMAVMIISSLFRRQLGIRYEVWRTIHAVFALGVILAAFYHVLEAGVYLDLPWKRGLWGGFATGTVFLFLYMRLGKPLALIRKPYRVERVIQERGHARTLVLEADGHAGMRFLAGQFVWLTLGDSPFRIEDHPFSISSSAERPKRLELTIKALGDYSGAAGKAAPGTRAYLEGPHGAFTLERHRDKAGFVFVAGGVGITPIMSMLRTMADRHDTRPALLIYANVHWDAIIFREELESLARKPALRVVHVLDKPPEGWEGESGFITTDLLARHLPPERRTQMYFLCGPPPMMEAVERALLDIGVPMENIDLERFNFV